MTKSQNSTFYWTSITPSWGKYILVLKPVQSMVNTILINNLEINNRFKVTWNEINTYLNEIRLSSLTTFSNHVTSFQPIRSFQSHHVTSSQPITGLQSHHVTSSQPITSPQSHHVTSSRPIKCHYLRFEARLSSSTTPVVAIVTDYTQTTISADTIKTIKESPGSKWVSCVCSTWCCCCYCWDFKSREGES